MPLSLRLLAAFLTVAPIAFSAELRGVVLDVTGAPVPAARLNLSTASLVSAAGAVADLEGRFRFERVAPGHYALAVNKPGFAEYRAAVELRDSESTELTVRLSLHAVQAELTVSAEISNVLPLDGVAQPVTLISGEELRERALVLSDVADGKAGIHQLRTSPTLGAFFVRGLTGKNVAVFRDGVRYTTSAQRGGISTFLNLLRPEELDRVEVLRGPNSAQYGSDSLGGAVAALSRPAPLGLPAPSCHGSVAAMYMSAAHAFGSTAGLDCGGPRWGFYSDLTGQRFNTLRTGGGIDSHAAVTRFLGLPSAVFGERLPDTAFTAYGGSFHGQLRLAPNSQLVLHYERSQQDGGKRYDQLLGGDGNWIADLRNLMLDFGYLRYQQFGVGPFDQFSVSSSYNAQREERVNQGGQGNPLGAITHQYEKTKAWGLQFNFDKRISDIDWLIGGEGYLERIVAPSFTFNPSTGAVALVRPRIPDHARYLTHGIYTQASWQPFSADRLRLIGALRFGGASYRSRASASPLVNGRPLWPDDSLSANAFSGRAGAVARIAGPLSAHIHYSRGFRVPNVTDLGTLGLQGNGAYEAAVADLAGLNATIGDRADDQAVSTGQPVERLRPEVSDNIDFGLRLRTARLEADASAFWMRLDNTIISQTLILAPGAVGLQLGEQTVTRQLASGAVFVPISTGPVLVRANFSGARMRGFEQWTEFRLTSAWSLRQNATYIYAEDLRTGLPPDMEPGIPPLTGNVILGYSPGARRFWGEAYLTLAARQNRLSSLALSDRRIGNPRSRSNIQSFFNNGARTRGLVANGILIPTGETLAQVQNRVLGNATSAPQYPAIPGYALVGVRGGVKLGESTDLIADLFNIGDKNYRGIGWGIDGPGRGVMLRLRYRF